MNFKKKTVFGCFLVTFIIVVYLFYASMTSAETIVTDNTTKSTVDSNLTSTTTVKSPPPSAISPSINTSNSDLCTVGVAGAVQTQILGISAGKTFTEPNCLLLKKAKVMFDMGMKVSAVSIMCTDKTIFMSMKNAGTPCPIDGLVGSAALQQWEASPERWPDYKANGKKKWDEDDKNTAKGVIGIGGLFMSLLLLL
tara:strand:- start:2964 stop:3551 length:588 start_codon:yes stop_codon:yes gene_type:complete